MIKFSVVLLLYNSSRADILLSLQSILLQDIDSYELVVVDDGSREDQMGFIRDYLEKKGMDSFTLYRQPQNVGTVKNFLTGLHLCKGKYIKGLGAGDMLYAPHTLRRAYEISEQHHAKYIFGPACAYNKQEGTLVPRNVWIPAYLRPYRQRDAHSIKKYLLYHRNWVAGAVMAFDTQFLTRYVEEIDGILKYAEDLVQVLMVLDGELPFYMDEPLLLYEVNVGLTTESDLMKADNRAFMDFLLQKYPSDGMVHKAHRLFWKKEQREFPYQWKLVRGLQIALTYPNYVLLKCKARLPLQKKTAIRFAGSLQAAPEIQTILREES